MNKLRQQSLEKLRADLDAITWRSICEGCTDDKVGERLETKIHNLMVRARHLRPENFNADGKRIEAAEAARAADAAADNSKPINLIELAEQAVN